MPTQTDFAKALRLLHDGGLEYIIVGGPDPGTDPSWAEKVSL